MKTEKTTYAAFSDADMRSFEPAMKIGLLATVNPDGLPHITLISSIMAASATQIVWGQFTEGLSKDFIFKNPKTGFMVMSLDKSLWRGKAVFTHTAREGKDYEFYNNTPMFRYNAYFGVHTVYYMDLVSHTGKEALPMGQIIWAAVLSMIARRLGRKPGQAQALNLWTRTFLNKLDNLKFLAYVGEDGFPWIIPAIQAQSLDGQHVLFSSAVYGEELERIPPGSSLAVFGMALTMEDVLARGVYQGLQRVGGIRCGVLKVDWVYNPMPPAPGQIYPSVPLEAVRQF